MDAAHTGPVIPTFELLSLPWWQTSGATIAFTALMLLAVRLLREDQRALCARALGWLMLVWVVLPPLVHVFAGHWRVNSNLPLHWCDLTGAIAGLALLRRRQLFYEFALFWGLTGAASALLTPQFTQGSEWYYLAEFFISHSMLLAAPLYLSIYEDMRPRAWSWLGALAWLNVAALPVGAFDLVTDANYMFLLRGPTADLPIYKFGWPYHLLVFEIACLVTFVLIYLPFRLMRPVPARTSIAQVHILPIEGQP